MKLPPMDWIEKAIRINSTTYQTNEDLVRFLVPLLTDSGLKVEEQKVTENGVIFKNLIAFSHDLDTPDLLALNTHLDTVDAGSPEQWTKTGGDPFKATRVRDRIYGLGSADVKLDFLCKIWACRLARPWKRPFALIGTYGEERGLVGVQHLFKTKKIKPKYALVGEPSNLELIYAHKGHLIFTVSIPCKPEGKGIPTSQKKWRGLSAHSSTPDLGDNALLKGLTDIFKRGYGVVSLQAGTNFNKIPDSCEATLISGQNSTAKLIFSFLQFLEELKRQFKQRKDPRFSPSYTCLSLNMAASFHDRIEFTFDVRTLPDVDQSRLEKKIRDEITKLGAKVTGVTSDASLKGQKNSRFLVLASQSLKQCGVKPVLKTKATSTEAAIYQANGASAIVFGPGISVGNAHRPNEYNSLKQMEVATKFYSTLLKTQGGTL
ncbi:MAG: M20/M25/M40 family metallo-hydrolase [Proteobacteria bacterium]|nr:M20/M25/M40 family metallo-hydrolase [Pseudomonadota bacterium]